jgi:DNA-binding LytR/AlgR family response regulator
MALLRFSSFDFENEVLYIQADYSYSIIYLLNGESFKFAKTLKYFEIELTESFSRISRNILVNKNIPWQLYRDGLKYGEFSVQYSRRRKNIALKLVRNFEEEFSD